MNARGSSVEEQGALSLQGHQISDSRSTIPNFFLRTQPKRQVCREGSLRAPFREERWTAFDATEVSKSQES